MNFNNIVLIHRKEGKFLEEGIKLKVDECFENIKEFYEENGTIFLVLRLEQDFTDDEFHKMIGEFPYEDFENLGVDVSPKNDEYYPTFTIEIKCDSENCVKNIVDNILELFMRKVVKIYCND